MGTDTFTLKELLGHVDINTTLIYLHSLSRPRDGKGRQEDSF